MMVAILNPLTVFGSARLGTIPLTRVRHIREPDEAQHSLLLKPTASLSMFRRAKHNGFASILRKREPYSP